MKKNVSQQSVVSIYGPLGYGPSTLPLRHSAIAGSKRFVRRGIRTLAHRSGLRPERSALDHSAILTCCQYVYVYFTASPTNSRQIQLQLSFSTVSLARQLSWLERRANNAKVTGSIPLRAKYFLFLFLTKNGMKKNLLRPSRGSNPGPLG